MPGPAGTCSAVSASHAGILQIAARSQAVESAFSPQVRLPFCNRLEAHSYARTMSVDSSALKGSLFAIFIQETLMQNSICFAMLEIFLYKRQSKRKGM